MIQYTKMKHYLDEMQTATSEMGVELNLKYAQECQPFAIVEILARIAFDLDIILHEEYGYEVD